MFRIWLNEILLCSSLYRNVICYPFVIGNSNYYISEIQFSDRMLFALCFVSRIVPIEFVCTIHAEKDFLFDWIYFWFAKQCYLSCSFLCTYTNTFALRSLNSYSCSLYDAIWKRFWNMSIQIALSIYKFTNWIQLLIGTHWRTLYIIDVHFLFWILWPEVDQHYNLNTFKKFD